MNAAPVYDDRYDDKTKTRTYGDKIYTNFCSWNVTEGGVECLSFTITSIDSLLIFENKYYLQIYLNNCAYKSLDKQMTDYLDDLLLSSNIGILVVS